MNDLEVAISQLGEHSICLCKDGTYLIDDARGIAPLMRMLQEGRDLRGYACADRVIGKAAAMLMVKAGITSVYGGLVSVPAKAYLEVHGISCTCKEVVERIKNRQNTGFCPMEETVMEIEDIEQAYIALRNKLAQM